jgi:hypothetical protein
MFSNVLQLRTFKEGAYLRWLQKDFLKWEKAFLFRL